MNEIILWRGGQAIARARGEGEVNLCFEGLYEQGDAVSFISGTPQCVVRVDAAVAPARVYLPKGSFIYRLPLSGDNLAPYAPGAFGGDRHLLSLSPISDNPYRNLAANPADQRGDTDAYPHATANVETRNESVFCARNVIDGEHIACGHGHWPYGSWGIGAREDACLTLDFGRMVRADALSLYLRADFPHDAYWQSGTAVFSDGSEITFPLQKREGPQRVSFPDKRIAWVRLERLMKNDAPSQFPALRQLEVYGRDESSAFSNSTSATAAEPLSQ